MFITIQVPHGAARMRKVGQLRKASRRTSLDEKAISVSNRISSRCNNTPSIFFSQSTGEGGTGAREYIQGRTRTAFTAHAEFRSIIGIGGSWHGSPGIQVNSMGVHLADIWHPDGAADWLIDEISSGYRTKERGRGSKIRGNSPVNATDRRGFR